MPILHAEIEIFSVIFQIFIMKNISQKDNSIVYYIVNSIVF